MHPHAPSILTAIFSLSSDPFTARLWPIGRRVKGQSLILAAIAYCRRKFWTFYHHKIVLNHSILMVLMALYMVQPSLRYKPVFGMHPMHPPCTLHSHGHFLTQF